MYSFDSRVRYSSELAENGKLSPDGIVNYLDMGVRGIVFEMEGTFYGRSRHGYGRAY